MTLEIPRSLETEEDEAVVHMSGFHLYTADRQTPSICTDDSAVQSVIARPPPHPWEAQRSRIPPTVEQRSLKPTQSEAPEGPADRISRTATRIGKDQGDSDPGYCLHHATVIGSPKPETTQSSAVVGNRAPPVGGDLLPLGGRMKSPGESGDTLNKLPSSGTS